MLRFSVKINDKDIENPALKFLIAFAIFIIVGIVSALVIFFVLPLLSIVVGLGVGLLCALIIGLGVAIVVFLVGGGLLGFLAASAISQKPRIKKH